MATFKAVIKKGNKRADGTWNFPTFFRVSPKTQLQAYTLKHTIS